MVGGWQVGGGRAVWLRDLWVASGEVLAYVSDEVQCVVQHKKRKIGRLIRVNAGNEVQHCMVMFYGK